jgi:hypothetical protein
MMRHDQGLAAGFILSIALALLAPGPVHARGVILAAPAPAAFETIRWPDGTEVLDFENLEGVILLESRLSGGGRDTSGLLVLDTGAGHLALDAPLAVRLGILDQLPASRRDVGLALLPLERLELGALQHDLVSPVMTVDAEIVRRVTDRPVLGLLGQSMFDGRALWIDYEVEKLAVVPLAPRGDDSEVPRREDPADVPSAEWNRRVAASREALAMVLGAGAAPVPFEVEGDGKIVVSAKVSNPSPPRWSRRIELILDTGATKSVLFAPAIDGQVKAAKRWSRLEGLSAPTLFGSESASIAWIPRIEVRAPKGGVKRDGMDAAVLEGELGPLLSQATGRTVHGLLGYSFLRHFRIGIDFAHRVLWLEPSAVESDDHRNEYSHPGLQLERDGESVRVVAVALRSPAAEAGIAAGDLLVSIDGESATAIPIVALARRLEGEPGSSVDLVMRRGDREQRYRIVRRRLL